MKLPRDLSANQLIKALRVLGYSIDLQRGSHVRIVTQLNGQHHETIPNHSPIKIGTLAHILRNIARHHNFTIEDLLSQLDLCGDGDHRRGVELTVLAK